MVLYLVRHGRPIIDPSVPSSAWVLDPDHEHLVTELAARAPWSADAVWFSSPEPKAVRTARLLAGRDVPVVRDLREHERQAAGLVPDFVRAIAEAFATPDAEVRPGWEPTARTQARTVVAAGRIIEDHPGRDIVLVGHGTAWTLLAAALTGSEPDLGRWRALSMPDVITVDTTEGGNAGKA
ncbi:histidine phosphatase family protein [Promicromonospora citrea]|uniref:histidine phosphatase family protein n=1 Tax=Promicromonospora citrea TaxID=43677 RepID=UPI0014890A3A|nr:histidine phosphatase family protein [Promicromonospora citrea]NNH51798.1 histidine phosphatase family protein [Promicromonospora citrea]